MSFKLQRDFTGDFDFLATPGETVNLRVRGSAPAQIVSAELNGSPLIISESDGASFTVPEGIGRLILTLAALPGGPVEILEDGGDGRLELLRHASAENPIVSMSIKGVWGSPGTAWCSKCQKDILGARPGDRCPLHGITLT